MKIGGALKFNRQLQGLTLDSLAKNLNSIYDDENFTKSKLSKWERDIEQPTLTSIKKVADYFGCTLDSMIEMSKDDEEKRNEIRFNRYSETLREVGFDVGGILPVLLKNTAPVDKKILQSIIEEFGEDNVFNNVVKNMERLKRYDLTGIVDPNINKSSDMHDKKVHKLYIELAKEFIEKVNKVGEY